MKSKNKCPHCNTVLQFDRAKYQTVTCPKCKKSAPVSEYKEVLDEGRTEIKTTNNTQGKMYKPGQLQFLQNSDNVPWLVESKLIPLQRGENIIARCSLPIEDMYMSRKKHAIIEVRYKEDATFAHYLRDDESRNKTFHNNDPLEEGDIIKLNPNDTIKLGHTTFKFIESD